MPHAGLFRLMPLFAPRLAHPLKSTVSYDYLIQCLTCPADFRSTTSSTDGGRGSLSYEPYEFSEEIPSNVLTTGGPHRRYWVTFSFTKHVDCDNLKSADYYHRLHEFSQRKGSMSWRPYITVRDMSYSRSELLNLPLLHLELDPALLNTAYGHLLKSDPTIVMRAMGVSLDKGMPVTIKLAHFSYP
ncbi:hypothetical protein B0H14DRAFT_3875469 [Mycena olivaceomarginata]|nr:hypothetical protein B0H14DRAFT_3875469 [Mycena olivaceomarginata]